MSRARFIIRAGQGVALGAEGLTGYRQAAKCEPQASSRLIRAATETLCARTTGGDSFKTCPT